MNVRLRKEDGAFWATVDEYRGVFAAGDDLEELRASLEEGICLIRTAPGDELLELRLSELRREPGEAMASAILA